MKRFLPALDSGAKKTAGEMSRPAGLSRSARKLALGGCPCGSVGQGGFSFSWQQPAHSMERARSLQLGVGGPGGPPGRRPDQPTRAAIIETIAASGVIFTGDGRIPVGDQGEPARHD